MLWLSIVLAVFLLYVALQGLDWGSFFSSLRKANYVFLPLIFVWSSSNCFIRALRWRVLLNTESEISPLNVFWANMAGYLGNAILPARAGELVRAVYVGNQNNIPTSFALTTGLVERFVDLIALIILGSVSFSLTGFVSTPFKNALISLSIIGTTGLVLIMFLPYFKTQVMKFSMALPVLSTSAKEKFSQLLDHFLRGLQALHHPGRIFIFILFTMCIWTMDGLGTVFLAHVFHLKFSLIQAFLLLAALGLSSAIPSTPGYIGVYQFVAVVVLKPFGISSAIALAFILLLQVMNLLVVSLWGILALLRSPEQFAKTSF